MSKNLPPLCVDLDGTLVATDTLWESVLVLLKNNPLFIFMLPIWLWSGRAYLKAKLAQQVSLNVQLLPYRENVLDFLRHEQGIRGRKLILATAAHESIAEAIAKHLGIFEEIIASDAQTNMKGTRKRDELLQRFQSFDYMGDSKADLPIFKAARQAYLVAASPSLRKQVECPADRLFPTPRIGYLGWLRLLRVHQWVKNTLLFVPLLLSHQFLSVELLIASALAFISFCFASSAGYVLNDLLDLPADRGHSTKRFRPFAAGQIPIQYGPPLFTLLVIAGLGVAMQGLSLGFAGLLSLYLLLTLSYSFFIKSKLVLDVIVLAGLYTLRIFAGGIAIGVGISSWLLVFSMFIFMSLAFLKRYIELLQLSDQQKGIQHRSYIVDDIDMIASFGPVSGYLAVLVFSLYIYSDNVKILYQAPFILYLVCPFLVYWITRLWFLARRRQMLDDPVLFALKDQTSWVVIGFIILFMALAKFIVE